MKHRWTAAAALTLAASVGAIGQLTADNGSLEVRVLSNRADLLSGGDALVEIDSPSNAATGLRIAVSSAAGVHDVTPQFALRSNGKIQGLVTGLPNGSSEIVASLNGRTARLAVTNHPIGGPIFAGPQVTPWICSTEQNGLGPAKDAQCNAPSKVEWFYKPADSANLKPYDPAKPAKDIADAVTDEGRVVPYIVRREMGTVDRAIYVYAVLADPSAPAPAPWAPPAAWNHKLYWTFGGGAAPGHQQATPGSVFIDAALSRGFAVATTSLDTFGNNFNSVVSAENVMMLKEHIIETMGEVRYTISTGGSGGAMQQQLITAAYPGLLDGIEPSASFVDIWTNYREIQDCSLMLRYFKETAAGNWQDVKQRNAVMDNANELPGTCEAWRDTRLTWAAPNGPGCVAATGRGQAAPHPDWIYDQKSNRNGVRCTLQDYQVAIFGKGSDGFARRAYDNVGVQYGLNAFQQGLITAEQFVDLNEKIGGLDVDLNFVKDRSVADPQALSIAFRTSQINMGGSMNLVPIIDNRACRNVEVHSCYHTYVTRARLGQTFGTFANQVVFLNAPGNTAFLALDRWVAAVKADTSATPQATKVINDRPADVVDSCWINGERTSDAAACRAANPYFGNAHLGAGQSMVDGVLKCQLKPLNRADYKQTLTDQQWSRLQAALPGGACDWTKPSVGATQAIAWLSYVDGPGGKPLGAAPVSRQSTAAVKGLP